MREIELANGRGVAVIDDEDYDLVSQYHWRLLDQKKRGKKYARGRRPGAGDVYLHRLLIPDAPRVDHIDGNGLNNQRENLRPATHLQNMRNQRPKTGRRFRGINRRSNGKWRAYIGTSQRALGTFVTPDEAARAYDAAARQLYGEWARLNFPPETLAA